MTCDAPNNDICSGDLKYFVTLGCDAERSLPTVVLVGKATIVACTPVPAAERRSRPQHRAVEYEWRLTNVKRREQSIKPKISPTAGFGSSRFERAVFRCALPTCLT
jgi:hypothetical protein